MTKETTYAGMLGSWQRWVAALLANGSDLSHLQVPREQLGTLASRGQELIQTQSQLTAAKQDASQELGVVMVEGQRLVTVLKLAEFGVQPFRGRSRRKAAEPPPPLPE